MDDVLCFEEILAFRLGKTNRRADQSEDQFDARERINEERER